MFNFTWMISILKIISGSQADQPMGRKKRVETPNGVSRGIQFYKSDEIVKEISYAYWYV